MVESIVITDSEGNTLHSIDVGDLQPDTTLLGGLLSALQDFSSMVSGDEVQEMEMGAYRFLVSSVSDCYVVTIHTGVNENPKVVHDRVFTLCKKYEDRIENIRFKMELQELANSIGTKE